MSRRFSTRRSTSSSPSSAAADVSKASPMMARAMASEMIGRSLMMASPAPPASLSAGSSWDAIVAASLGPLAFCFLPSTTTEPAITLQCARTSCGSAWKPGWWSITSSAASPLTWRWKAAPSSSSPPLPAAMLAASLPATRSSFGLTRYFFAGSGASPAGASMEPSFTSSSVIVAASFWQPRPRSPARILASIFSTAGMMVFCSLGAPPEVFQLPLA
mmetsp:Transcript_62460/g.163954  ORF Transcript_62460/g.163954 Transcript_62460/m.163954 type:complete len:217 (+) Transcript_62460:2077-2727(+)